MCNALSSTDLLHIKCTHRRAIVNCSEPIEGTFAEYKCADLYTDPSLSVRRKIYCHEGTWDYELPKCQPGEFVLN